MIQDIGEFEFPSIRRLEDFDYSEFMTEKLADEYRKQIASMIDSFNEMMKNYSSNVAEEEHHKVCKFECCGCHGFSTKITKCDVCGMTEEEQDQHNDHVWGIIDETEGSYEVQMMRTFCHFLNAIYLGIGAKKQIDHI